MLQGKKLWALWHYWKQHIIQCPVTHSCLTLSDAMDCSPPGSSIHRDSPGKNMRVGCHAPLQGSSQPKDRIQVSCTADGFFAIWATITSSNVLLNYKEWKTALPLATVGIWKAMLITPTKSPNGIRDLKIDLILMASPLAAWINYRRKKKESTTGRKTKEWRILCEINVLILSGKVKEWESKSEIIFC